MTASRPRRVPAGTSTGTGAVDAARADREPITPRKARPLGVGIIGGGFMATVHTRAARAARARVVGLLGSTPARGKAAADALGVEAVERGRHPLPADSLIPGVGQQVDRVNLPVWLASASSSRAGRS